MMTRARSVRSRLTLLFSILLLPIVAYAVLLAWQNLHEHTDIRAAMISGPILLWVAAVGVVWFATDRQIAGPLRQLTRIAQSYSKGELSRRTMPSGPAELRALADTFNEMVARIAAREEELRDAIATRDAMLREIHHRVKNNLQIVTSLLNLQAKSVQAESAQRAFSDVQTRVKALALVHRYLYESNDLQSVDLGAFLKELAASLQLSYGIPEDQIEIQIEAESVWDVADHAVPLALFMTEAMTNALKHAFPQGRRGVIRIVLKSGADSVVRFSVEDNGIGLSETQGLGTGAQSLHGQAGIGTSNAGQSNLGMSLIKAFARQVDAKLTISGPPGTVVAIEFLTKSTAGVTGRTSHATKPEPAPRQA